ncbi:hypothetical protein J4429_01720 [Candidatus Pacearchaeota archaeon]|nr:hypothetical protein [Candidatus Pacearchaeota archaeon]
MKHNKIFSIITFSIILAVLVLPFISAQRYEDNYFRYGTIDTNGQLIPTNTPINNVKVLGFVCSSDNCATVSGRLWPDILTSTNDFMRLIYPTTLQSQYGYGVYVYKEGYIPYEISADWWGTNPNDPVGPYNDYLTRKEICNSKLMSMNVSHTDNIINIQAQIRSPVSSAGPLDYLPSELVSIYSANAQANLEIKKDSQIFYTETKYLTMLPSELKDLSFSIPDITEPGNYIVKVYTTVNNEQKCLSYNQDSKQEILVIPENQIACNMNSDCGTDGSLGYPDYCIENQIFKDFIYYTCHNPGTEQSYCSNQTLPFLTETCNADYESDNYCEEGNLYKDIHDFSCSIGSCQEQTTKELVEMCANGCTNNACISVCSQNSDCGTNGYIGDKFCKQDGNVYQNYKTFNCNNPDTLQSTCSSAIEEKKVEDCALGCNNGQCNQPECTEDSECPAGEFCINNVCNPPACSQNSDCGTDECNGDPDYCIEKQIFQDFIIYTCNNPGQKNSYCSNQLFPFLMETCPNNYYSDAYCENNNIYKDLHNFGCATGSCFEEVSKELFQTCTNGCNSNTNTCNSQATDSTAPLITLITPLNNTSVYQGIVNFLFNVSDESNISKCDLIIKHNNSEMVMNSSTTISKTQTNTLAHNFEMTGLHEWRITCTDEFNNNGTSEKRALVIIENPQPVCQTDNDCGNASSELICKNNNLTRKTTTPKCVLNILNSAYECQNQITYELEEECNNKCEVKNSVARCKPSSSHSSKDEKCYDENGDEIDCEEAYIKKTQTRKTTTNYEPKSSATSTNQAIETNQSTTQYLNNLIQSSKYNINYFMYAITGLVALLAIIVLALLLSRKPKKKLGKNK